MPLYRLRYLASRRSPTQYRSVSGRYWSRGWVDLETRVFVGKPVDDTLYLLGEAVKVTSQVAPPDDLVLELTFYEGNGTVVHDSSKYGNHGTIYGAVWTQENGVYGLFFDGVDDYVLSSTFPEITPPFTIVVLAKVVSRGYPYATLFAGNGDYKSKGFGFYLREDGFLYFAMEAPNQHQETRVDGAPRNVWAQYFVIIDSNWNVYLGWNGEIKHGPKAFDPNIYTPATGLLICGKASSCFYFGRGYVALLQIWTRELSETEIREIYDIAASVLLLG